MGSQIRKPEVAFSDMGGAALEQFSPKHRQQLEFRNAKRVQHTLVTAAEKKVLLWIAARMPRHVNPDHLTMLGFVAQFMVGVSYALSETDSAWLWAATVFLGLNWFGDSLDGTLARYRDQQRPRYGFYVDHIIDTFGATFLCVGLGLSGYMSPMVAMLLLVSFLILSIETYLSTYCIGQFKLGHFLFGPTEIRLILGLGNVALLYKPHVHFLGVLYPLFDLGGLIASIGMGFIVVVSAIRHTIVLYREERLP
jgi:phosphatidylglycerophosphate synthase